MNHVKIALTAVYKGKTKVENWF